MIFCGSGIFMARRFLWEVPCYIHIWAGLLFGLLAMMWVVALCSMVLGFNPGSHYLAVVVMVAVTTGVGCLAAKSSGARVELPEPGVVATVSTLTLLIVWLLHSHVILPREGALYGGQSTFGDLPMHLGMVTSIAEQGVFPPEYSIFPGKRLSYPFLINSLSSSLFLFGLPLRWAVLIPSDLLALCVVGGFVVLAREVLGDFRATALAAVLFFLNGGFGFFYFIDGAGADPERFTRIFHAFYQTPTNLVQQNIRWTNVICDMLIPQRTTLVGWNFLFLVLWLLWRGQESGERKYYFLAGVVAGSLPMVHTHTYLGIGIVAATWFFAGFQAKGWGAYVRRWMWFGIPALALSIPQLLYWTLEQSSQGNFVRFHFDWANDKDPWLWFWIKNVGIVFLFLLPAFLAAPRKQKKFLAAGVVIFIIADLILFQPNAYDNNKLFYIWYGLSCVVVAGYLRRLYERLGVIRSRQVLAGMVVFFAVFSASLSIAREVLSEYRLFSASAVKAAEFARTETPKDALFISADFHNNPIAALAGRRILVGSPSYLFFHGLHYQERAEDVRRMYTQPAGFEQLRQRYGVDYVFFSSYERGQFHTDATAFAARYPIVFHDGEIKIFAVSPRAIRLARESSGQEEADGS